MRIAVWFSATLLVSGVPSESARADRAVRPGARGLVFRFPDTDALLQDAADRRTLSGPVAIAVTPIADPLPCALASAPCTEQPNLLACVDQLFTDDGNCGHAQ